MSRASIEAAIPHRDPFLFLDRVVAEGAEDGARWLEAEWTVPAEAPFLGGHFPGAPITPGVLLAEHAFQAAAVLISRARGGFAPEDGVPVLARIQDARYRRPVLPGETVVTRVTLEETVGPAWRLSARVACGGARVAALSFVLTASGAVARLGL